MLDPVNIMKDVSSDVLLWSGFQKVLRRILTNEDFDEAIREYSCYKKLDGLTDKVSLVETMTPERFWAVNCGHFPILQKKVASRILDLRAGTRCVESHFSVMGMVHSKLDKRPKPNGELTRSQGHQGHF